MGRLYLVELTVENSNVTSLYEMSLDVGNIGIGGTSIDFTPSSPSNEPTSIVTGPETVRVRIPPVTKLRTDSVVRDDSDVIAGRLLVFPPITVPLTVTLHDSSGEIGRAEVPPGGKDATFHFRVKDRKAFDDAEAVTAAAKRL